MPQALDNKHDKGPAQNESLGRNSARKHTSSRRMEEREDEVELKVAVR
jgi:hypothetical protein